MTETTKTHVILLACGSFNPITKGHIHMFGGCVRGARLGGGEDRRGTRSSALGSWRLLEAPGGRRGQVTGRGARARCPFPDPPQGWGGCGPWWGAGGRPGAMLGEVEVGRDGGADLDPPRRGRGTDAGCGVDAAGCARVRQKTDTGTEMEEKEEEEVGEEEE